MINHRSRLVALARVVLLALMAAAALTLISAPAGSVLPLLAMVQDWLRGFGAQIGTAGLVGLALAGFLVGRRASSIRPADHYPHPAE